MAYINKSPNYCERNDTLGKRVTFQGRMIAKQSYVLIVRTKIPRTRIGFEVEYSSTVPARRARLPRTSEQKNFDSLQHTVVIPILCTVEHGSEAMQA